MAYHDYEYLDLVRHVLSYGHTKTDRTGTGTISSFGNQMTFDLSDETIPLLTTKKMHLKSVIYEILWYLRGDTNIKYLNDNGVTIWDEWANDQGDLGPVYGKQWRKWNTYKNVEGLHYTAYKDPDHVHIHDVNSYFVPGEPIDQIKDVISELKTRPDSRRMLVTNWNVGDLNNMALHPCHYAFQLWTRLLSFEERGELFNEHNSVFYEDSSIAFLQDLYEQHNVPKYSISLKVNQRSCDVGLGVPFNIVQYAILLRMFAKVANMAPGHLIWSGGDVHIYKNHVEQLKEQITRNPRPSPKLFIDRNIKDINDFRFEDFNIVSYDPYPAIKMEVSV